METKRDISPGAEEELGKEYRIFDKGFVMLVDYIGNDHTIASSARVSYGKVTPEEKRDKELIRYLMRNKHTSPFEMVEFKFHVKLPIFVARQWIRHRTANVNEKSGRYSELKDEFYIPSNERIKLQSEVNKQGSGEALPLEERIEIVKSLNDSSVAAFDLYQGFLDKNVAKELARINLPLSTYTEWYWKIDLHNLFHFLRLRMDSHAQEEIRAYANKMGEIVKHSVPIAWEAFEDYTLGSMTLSKMEIELVKDIIKGKTLEDVATTIENKFEKHEFLEKMKRLG